VFALGLRIRRFKSGADTLVTVTSKTGAVMEFEFSPRATNDAIKRALPVMIKYQLKVRAYEAKKKADRRRKLEEKKRKEMESAVNGI